MIAHWQKTPTVCQFTIIFSLRKEMTVGWKSGGGNNRRSKPGNRLGTGYTLYGTPRYPSTIICSNQTTTCWYLLEFMSSSVHEILKYVWKLHYPLISLNVLTKKIALTRSEERSEISMSNILGHFSMNNLSRVWCSMFRAQTYGLAYPPRILLVATLPKGRGSWS
jgi:hypothetical protein